MVPTHSYFGDDFCVIEHDCTGTVPDEFLGVPGNGRRINFRMVHIFEFRDDLISRENVWLGGGSVVQVDLHRRRRRSRTFGGCRRRA